MGRAALRDGRTGLNPPQPLVYSSDFLHWRDSMIPDLTPLFQLLFFAFGFVPAIVVASIASVFLPVPLWAALLASSVMGGIVAFLLSRKA